MNAIAPIGHNNPPDPIDDALAPYADAIAEAENWLDGTPVTTEAQMKAVDALLSDVRAALKAVTEAEQSATKPLHDQWKAKKALFKPTITDLENTKKGLAAVVNGIKRQLAEEQAEKERQARIAAAAARREVEDAARAADASNIEDMRAVEQAKQDAVTAQAEVRAVAATKVKGLRTVSRYEIEDYRAALNDIAKNDREAVAAFVDDYVRRNHKARAIAGVRVWTEKEAI